MLIGKPQFLQGERVNIASAVKQIEAMSAKGDMVIAVAINRRLAGLIGIADQIKPDVRYAI